MKRTLPRVLYIAGSGRSGSTLLTRMLAQIDGVTSVGEVRHIWRTSALSLSQDELCGCGRAFSECPFWNEVVTELLALHPDFDLDATLELQQRVDRIRYIPRMLSGASNPFSRDLLEYRSLLVDLYCLIAEREEASVVVDSSKDPSTLFLLSTVPGLEVSVVHLIRDARAVAFSWGRSKVRPELPGRKAMMMRQGLIKVSSLWDYGNMLSELSRRYLDRYWRIRYEDFLAAPVQSLSQVCEASGIEEPGLDFLTDEWVSFDRETHTISGNPGRFETGEVELRTDSRWQAEMGRGARWAVVAMTWPWLARYGYPLGSKPPTSPLDLAQGAEGDR